MNEPALTVLLIEPDPCQAKSIKEYLAAARQPRLETVYEGQLSNGLMRLANGNYDAILLDLEIPGNQGMDALQQVQSHAGHAPILVLSGADDCSDALAALRLGAQDCLVKSQLSAFTLSRAVLFAVSRSHAAAAPSAAETLSLLSSEASEAPLNVSQLAEASVNSLAKFPSENPNPVLRLRKDGLILYANEASQELLQQWESNPGQLTPQFWRDQIAKATLNRSTVSVDVPLGTRFFSFLIVPVSGTNYVNLYGRDITEHEQAEERLRQVNRVLRALEQIHQLITREPDPRRLLSGACEILAINRDYRMVWIGLVEPGHHRVVPVASAGEGTDYLDQITVTWDDSPAGQGPAGTSIRARRACISQDLASDPRFTPWRQVATQRGYAATLAVPMIYGERLFGTLVTYAPQPDAYSDEEIDLFATLAVDLALALQNREEEVRRKEAEEALQIYSEQLEEMVAQRAQQLQDVQDQLVRQEKLAVLGQLAGSVAHELRNPLGVISNAVYFLNLTLSDLDETTREYLELIASEVRSAERIISDLLDFSRSRIATRAYADLGELVALVLAKYPAPEGVVVENRVDPDLPTAFVDPHQIEQVLANLILNAYQAMPERGRLSIGSQVLSDQICISVADTGCGIPAENLPRIFEPLFTTKARGIGLGLAVCRKLVEANEGVIEVESREGQGTTFSVRLPITARGDG
jgi:signal transduction histidine kinase/DNA-binding NarL/FixJ family response regulator